MRSIRIRPVAKPARALRLHALMRSGVTALVSKSAIVASGLAVVVRCAEGLPVALVPEQVLVPSVRLLVVNHVSGYQPARLSLAVNAERMIDQPGCSRFLPIPGVAALPSRWSLVIASALSPDGNEVLFAVALFRHGDLATPHVIA